MEGFDVHLVCLIRLGVIGALRQSMHHPLDAIVTDDSQSMAQRLGIETDVAH